MTHESLANAWDSGRAALGGWVTGGGDFTVAILRRAGYDYVAIDCQHTTMDEATVATILQRTPPSGPATIVRVSKNDPALIGRLVDAGADGVIVPMVSIPEEAEAAVAAVRYPPAGVRSCGPMRPDLLVDDLRVLEDRVSIFVMIETALGLDNVEKIAAVPGLAGIYVGPADLSIGLGLSPRGAFTSDQLVEPLQRIRYACQAASIIFGMHQMSAETAVKWISRGVQMASLSTDAGMLMSTAMTYRDDTLRGIQPVPRMRG